jgi:hypothetical protein
MILENSLKKENEANKSIIKQSQRAPCINLELSHAGYACISADLCLSSADYIIQFPPYPLVQIVQCMKMSQVGIDFVPGLSSIRLLF